MHVNNFKTKPMLLAVLLACQPAVNATAAELELAPIVVTATRTAQNSFDLPVSIDTLDQQVIQEGQLQVRLSESLLRVPGVTAQNRFNEAQAPKIQTRGFGARTSFGVRGIRLYVDGIPLSMPDGQGNPGIVDMSTVDHIEVMRGPFSALYGNSSGGVIQLFTEAIPKTPTVSASTIFGSYNTRRNVITAAGTSEKIGYSLNVSNFDTDGYRDHSKAKRELVTAKFDVDLGDKTDLTFLVNHLDQQAQDPNGLPREATALAPSAFDDPRGVSDAVLNADTRVVRSHTQVGMNFRHAFDTHNAINVMAYVGSRDNQTIIATRANGSWAKDSSISREFYGTDIRWDNNGQLFNRNYQLSVGLNAGQSTDARTSATVLRNFVSTNLPDRDEDDVVNNFDQYIQGQYAILENVDIHAGLRHTKVRLEVDDKLINADNPDNSGRVTYQKTTPAFGVVWKVTPAFNLYANYGEGFETPTFFEAAFDSTDDDTKPNLSLKASESRNYEVGAKAFITDSTQMNISLFRIDTQDELVVKESASGRSVYTNANDTKRTGLELSVQSSFDNNLSTYFSYSVLNAKYTSDFTRSKIGFGATGNDVIAAGNTIPGTYKTQLYGEVAWDYQPLGFSTAFEGIHRSKVYVDDVNSDAAPSYTIFNLRAGFTQQLGHWRLNETLRVGNVFDKKYISSVRINDSRSRFFEPAADRNYLLSLSASYEF